VNYFAYNYTGPKNGDPFSAQVEVASAPWKPEHRLVRSDSKVVKLPRTNGRPATWCF